jgi:hypothetical protein
MISLILVDNFDIQHIQPISGLNTVNNITVLVQPALKNHGPQFQNFLGPFQNFPYKLSFTHSLAKNTENS